MNPKIGVNAFYFCVLRGAFLDVALEQGGGIHVCTAAGAGPNAQEAPQQAQVQIVHKPCAKSAHAKEGSKLHHMASLGWGLGVQLLLFAFSLLVCPSHAAKVRRRASAEQRISQRQPCSR